MSIVTNADFKGEIRIANITDAVVSANLQVFITKYEAKYLLLLLGPAFSALFVAGLAEVMPDARWIVLKALVEPAIADYVFYWYQRDLITQTTGVGNVATDTANATQSTSGGKLTRAFNECVQISWDTLNTLLNDPVDYPEFVAPAWLNWYYNQYRRSNDYDPRPEIFVPINDMNI